MSYKKCGFIAKPRYTTVEAADFIGCASNTLRMSRVSGVLLGVQAPPFRKFGRKVIYDHSELEGWLGQFETHTSTAQYGSAA